MEDVHEQVLAQRALHESEKRYKDILNNIEEGYHEVDIEGNFTYCNNAMCRILGYSKDELLCMNYRQYMDEENSMNVLRIYNKIYYSHEPASLSSTNVIRKDGSVCTIESSFSLRKDSKKVPVGFSGITRSISG